MMAIKYGDKFAPQAARVVTIGCKEPATICYIDVQIGLIFGD